MLTEARGSCWNLEFEIYIFICMNLLLNSLLSSPSVKKMDLLLIESRGYGCLFVEPRKKECQAISLV